MLATIGSATLQGIRGRPITVEVHVSGGLPGFTVVGLPDASCREARDRVRAAVQTSGFQWPVSRVTVNLAPTGVPKTGAGLDLAIAVGVLVASRSLPPGAVADLAFIAELGLDGSLRPVPGALPLTAAANEATVVIAPANVAEASLVMDRRVCAAPSLGELVAVLVGERPWPRSPPPVRAASPPALVDLARVQGQPVARRAAEITAAGGHHLLLVGPPGAGKTMIAKAIPGLLPHLSGDDALEVTAVHSAAGLGLPPAGMVTSPPFRAPHHTSSTVALVGGGARGVRPGEISCAHGGVLFLDELAEFPAVVLDALRQPLEEGVVRVSRAAGSVTLPARFILVGATNPCPCGAHSASDALACRCSEASRARYLRRLSAPLLDRFDLRVHVSRPSAAELFCAEPAESSSEVAARVETARAIAASRGTRNNVVLSPERLDEVAPLQPVAKSMLVRAIEGGRLSARGVHRVRCVARTIADLAAREGPVSVDDVAAALALRAELHDQAFVLEAS